MQLLTFRMELLLRSINDRFGHSDRRDGVSDESEIRLLAKDNDSRAGIQPRLKIWLNNSNNENHIQTFGI